MLKEQYNNNSPISETITRVNANTNISNYIYNRTKIGNRNVINK